MSKPEIPISTQIQVTQLMAMAAGTGSSHQTTATTAAPPETYVKALLQTPETDSVKDINAGFQGMNPLLSEPSI